jgi:hypothetical protein
MNRRYFIATSGLATAAIGISNTAAVSEAQKEKNKLPQWRGINVLDFFSPNPNHLLCCSMSFKSVVSEFSWT